MRADEGLPNGFKIPNGTHLPYYTQVNAGTSHVLRLDNAKTLTARFDIINVFDKIYEIRNGIALNCSYRIERSS